MTYNKQQAIQDTRDKLRHYQNLHSEFMQLIEAGDTDDDEDN